MNSSIAFDVTTVTLPTGKERMLCARAALPHLTAPISFDLTDHAATMYIASLRPNPGARPLVVVADVDGLCLKNHGASVTNAAERVVAEIGPALAQLHGVALVDLEWIAVDSEGFYDRWWPARDSLEFQPLLAPAASGIPNRSKEAFHATYPKAGFALTRELVWMVVNDTCHGRTNAVH